MFEVCVCVLQTKLQEQGTNADKTAHKIMNTPRWKVGDTLNGKWRSGKVKWWETEWRKVKGSFGWKFVLMIMVGINPQALQAPVWGLSILWRFIVFQCIYLVSKWFQVSMSDQFQFCPNSILCSSNKIQSASTQTLSAATLFMIFWAPVGYPLSELIWGLICYLNTCSIKGA